ncbi:MAG: hypothetical protein LUD74_02780 [Tannerellaceae bacterium]|nr:hypothetical protein [Tannerellaceae bacterium]
MLKRTLLFFLLLIPLWGWSITIENVTTVPATCYGNGEIHIQTDGGTGGEIDYYLYRNGINYASQENDNISSVFLREPIRFR